MESVETCQVFLNLTGLSSRCNALESASHQSDLTRPDKSAMITVVHNLTITAHSRAPSTYSPFKAATCRAWSTWMPIYDAGRERYGYAERLVVYLPLQGVVIL